MTVNVYGVPADNPLITQLVVSDSHVFPAPAVAMYLMIADPPLFADAVHEIVAELSFTATAETLVGASGATIATITAGSLVIDTCT